LQITTKCDSLTVIRT